MPLKEGMYEVQLAVVDELLGFRWEDNQHEKKRSMREMENHILIYGSHRNPMVHATFKNENGQIPCIEIETRRGGTSTWCFQQEAGANARDAEFIWNAVTSSGRNWAPVPHRESSLYLLYFSGDRRCITIQERNRPNHMRFTRVPPEGGGAGSALLPALERVVALMTKAATDGAVEIMLGMVCNPNPRATWVYPYWQSVDMEHPNKRRSVTFKGRDVTVYFAGTFVLGGETFTGTLPEEADIAAIQKGPWKLTYVQSDDSQMVKQVWGDEWVGQSVALTYTCGDVQIVLRKQ